MKWPAWKVVSSRGNQALIEKKKKGEQKIWEEFENMLV